MASIREAGSKQEIHIGEEAAVEEAAVEEAAVEEGRFRVLKVAVLFGAAVVGLSRMAAMFIWIMIP